MSFDQDLTKLLLNLYVCCKLVHRGYDVATQFVINACDTESSQLLPEFISLNWSNFFKSNTVTRGTYSPICVGGKMGIPHVSKQADMFLVFYFSSYYYCTCFFSYASLSHVQVTNRSTEQWLSQCSCYMRPENILLPVPDCCAPTCWI